MQYKLVHVDQAFYHRQTASMVVKQVNNNRKPQSLSYSKIVTMPRRSQPIQITSYSPAKNTNPLLQHKLSYDQRISTQVGSGKPPSLSETLKLEDGYYFKIKELYKQDNDSQMQTKTTTLESNDDLIRVKSKHNTIDLQKLIFEKDLKIIQLEKQIKETNKKYNKLLEEHEKLKLDHESVRRKEHQSRNSDFVSALTEQDKIKIQSLVFQDSS
ncbi:hypothetical protein pb186bvf_008967 [Paramecium bursaria]